MRMAYTRSVMRSSVSGRRRCQVRSQAVPRDLSQAHGVGLLSRPPRAAAVHCRSRPRQEARDAVRVPRFLVVRGRDLVSDKVEDRSHPLLRTLPAAASYAVCICPVVRPGAMVMHRKGQLRRTSYAVCIILVSPTAAGTSHGVRGESSLGLPVGGV